MNVKTLTAACALAAAFTAPATATTVALDYRYPDINSVYIAIATYPVPAQVNVFGGNVILDISPTQIRVSNREGCQPCQFLTGSFNGFSLTFSDLDVLGTAINPSTTFSSFTADRITFQGNTLFLNFVNLYQFNPQFLLLDISTGPIGGGGVDPIPEPASWALLIAGFGLTGAAMRRRRAAIGA